SRRRDTRLVSDWSSDVCSSDLFEAADLLDGRLGVRRRRVGHRLNRDRRVAADFDAADADLTRLAPLDPPPRADVVKIAGGAVHRSEERRVGKECREWGAAVQYT